MKFVIKQVEPIYFELIKHMGNLHTVFHFFLKPTVLQHRMLTVQF